MHYFLNQSAHVCLYFAPATCICLEFDWLTGLPMSFTIGQWLLWSGFYDTQLKIAQIVATNFDSSGYIYEQKESYNSQALQDNIILARDWIKQQMPPFE